MIISPPSKNYTLKTVAIVSAPTCYSQHTVVSGNSCSAIKDQYGLPSLDILFDCNPDLDCANLQIGQKVCISCYRDCKRNYTVASGDYCSKIADDSKISLANLQHCNPAVKCEDLQIGWTLCTDCDKQCFDKYSVVSEDTCSKIAGDNSLTLDDLTDCQPYLDCANLQIGQNLCVNCRSICYEKYTVASGDGCSAIANSFGITTDQLLSCNGKGLNCSSLSVGQKLCGNCLGACDARQKVVSGDSCSKIATENGIELSDLLKCNPGLVCENIQVGQNLCVKCPAIANSNSTTMPSPSPTAIANSNSTTKPSPSPTPTPESKCYELYAIKSGDTCWDISVAAGLSLNDFYECNPGINCAALNIGDMVCVNCKSPCFGKYKVKGGDTCSKIAESSGISLEKLQKCNPGVVCEKLEVDQQLCVNCDGPFVSTSTTNAVFSTTKIPVKTTEGSSTTLSASLVDLAISALLFLLFLF